MKIWINGRLVDEDQATVSVFDSGFVLGDGIWEGLRVASGQPAFLEPHLARLYATAKAIMLDVGLSREELSQAIEQTIAANQLIDDAHLRVMVTRGRRRQPYQDPRLALGSATVVIVPALSPHDPAAARRGLDLFTVHVRRGPPDVQDQKINSHSKFNCIMACIQANQAGADEALMLDPRGFVATCNSTHFFMVRSGQVWTSAGGYCLGGITRGNVLALCREQGIEAFEKDFSLTEVYGADECFVTGTLGGITPVRQVDGRRLPGPVPGPLTEQLQGHYAELLQQDVARRKQ